MQFATFEQDGQVRVGTLLDAERVLDLTNADSLGRDLGVSGTMSVRDMVSLIESGDPALDAIRELAERVHAKGLTQSTVPLASVRLRAPFPRPTKNVFCVGRNYFKHAVEAAEARGEQLKLPDVPELFTKPPTSVIGPGDDIQYDSRVTIQVDYEVELAVVIGKRGKNIHRENAYDHVFGYTVVNDVSARDIQYAHGGQWFKGKALDDCCPMGPVLTHKSDIPNPHDLKISLKLNGETMQDDTTGEMTFDIPSLIEILSRGLTLEPGDVISTGTPPGVGHARKPPVYMKPGDIVEATVERIGTLRNRVGEDQNPDR